MTSEMYSFTSGTILSAGTCSPSTPGTQPVSLNISPTSFRRAISSLVMAFLMLTVLAHHPEADIVKFISLRKMGAKRHARQPGINAKRPASHHMPLAGRGALGVGRGANRVIVRVIKILHPFRYISAHVINAPHV